MKMQEEIGRCNGRALLLKGRERRVQRETAKYRTGRATGYARLEKELEDLSLLFSPSRPTHLDCLGQEFLTNPFIIQQKVWAVSLSLLVDHNE